MENIAVFLAIVFIVGLITSLIALLIRTEKDLKGMTDKKGNNVVTIDGRVAVPKDVDADKFSTEFIQWLESKGYTFGGGIGPYKIIEDDVDFKK